MFRIDFMLIFTLCAALLGAVLEAQAKLFSNLSRMQREIGALQRPLSWSLEDFNAATCTPFIWAELHLALRCSREGQQSQSAFLVVQ